MEKQDEMLDVLSSHVVQLNAMGTEIGTELDDQKRLLEDFDGELTKTQQRMEKVIGKMQDLLQTSNNGTLCLIVVLVIIAAVEFLLIMYT
jgi:chromosome segregation ATPase